MVCADTEWCPSLKTPPFQARNMAQLVMCLTYMCEELGLIPRTYVKKHGMVDTCNPSMGEVEPGRFLSLAGQPA